MPDDISLEPVWLSLELAAVTTVVLLILAAPLAWWLARTKSAWRAPVGAVVTLPLVLPPSVLRPVLSVPPVPVSELRPVQIQRLRLLFLLLSHHMQSHLL